MEGRFMTLQSKGTRVLILDDESTLRTALFRTLDRKGYSVVTSQTIEEAKSYCLPDKIFDLAIVDVNLPDGDGLEFMTHLKAIYPAIQVIVLTGFATIESAVKATQMGAYHFLTKPFSIEELLSVTEKALDHKNLQQENIKLRHELTSKYGFSNIIGESEGIKN